MKKLILSLFMLCACVMGMQAQWLYQVSKDSTAKVSYIMASCPLINPMGVVSHSEVVKNALSKTDQVYFEVNKDAYASTIQEGKKLADGKKLLSLLTPAQAAKLNAFLKKYMEVDFRSAYVQKKYGNLTPAALQEELSQLLFVANNMGKFDPTHTFDQYFTAQAKANGENVGGLSDVDSYVAATYQGDLKQQVSHLMTFLENESTELAKLNKATGAFMDKDLNTISQTLSPTVGKDTLQAWVTKMGEVMGEKPTLFVIDAANLGGEDGLLQQLTTAGYQVKGVE